MFRCVLTTLFLAFSITLSLHAQQTRPMARPGELGLMVPLGREAFEVTAKNVVLASEEGSEKKPAVAKVYLEVGGQYIVTMPDGSLRSVPKREVTDTDRPFEPLDDDDLAKKLKEQFKGFKTRATRHYLCVYNTSDGFCERKMTILETMYPMLVAYFKRQKLPIEKPATKLVVVMFRTKKEFLAYRKMPDSLLAYYNAVNNRVYMYQLSSVVRDAPMIAAMQSTSTISHEGVHQILHNIGVQKRLSDWPLWISEGLAEYFAPTSTMRSKWSGVGRPNDLRMRELFKYLRERPGVGNGSLIQSLVGAKDFTSTEYAVAWSLTHYLATKRKDDLFAYLRDVAEIAPLEVQSNQVELFVKHFGVDFAETEKEMIRHIRSLPYSDPVLNQPYFLISASNGKKRVAAIITSTDHAKARQKLIEKFNPAQRAKVRFFPVQVFRNRLQAQQALALFTR